MSLILVSFLAGILTVLAPCVLPVLPIILGGSLGTKSLARPAAIIFSLCVSILFFTLLLKVFVLQVPSEVLKLISSSIILIFGIFLVFPAIWEKISGKLQFQSAAQKGLSRASQKDGIWGWMLLGASLGPVFSACSPTYFLILGTVLPQNFWVGILNLLFFGLGLFLALFLVAVFGQKVLQKFRWAADSRGRFKKILGAIFIFLAISIYLEWDKKLEAKILDFKGFEKILDFESGLLGR